MITPPFLPNEKLLHSKLNALRDDIQAAEDLARSAALIRPEQFAPIGFTLGAGGDDTAAVQAAINLAAASGLQLQLRTIYNVNGLTIPATSKALTIVGEAVTMGLETSPPDSGAGFALRAGAAASVLTIEAGAAPPHLYNFSIFGNQAQQSSGTSFGIDLPTKGGSYGRAFKGERLRIERCRSGGIRVGDNRNAGELDDCTILNCGYNADGTPVSSFGDGILLAASNDWRVAGGDIGSCTRNGFYNTGADNLVITSTTLFANGARGLRVDSTAGTLRAAFCMIDRNYMDGVLLIGTGSTTHNQARELAYCLFAANSRDSDNTYSDIRIDDGDGQAGDQVLIVAPIFSESGDTPNRVKHNVETRGTTRAVQVRNPSYRTDSAKSYATAFCSSDAAIILTGAPHQGGGANGARGVSAHYPDSTVAGGNARGDYAVDWQTSRSSAAHVAAGTGSVVAGGRENRADGQDAVVGGGFANSAGGGQSSVPYGSNNSASGTFSRAAGSYAATRNMLGKDAFATGRFAATADAQIAQHVLRCQTTDATATRLTSDGGALNYISGIDVNVIILPNNGVFAVRGTVVARDTSTGDTKTWDVSGTIKRGANAAATALVGAATVTAGPADAGAAAWTLTLAANTTTGGPLLTGTGEAGKTIRWLARIETVELA